MSKIDKIKEYLKNPYETNLFYSEFRFDFDSIRSQEEDEILKMFSINYLNLIRNEDFLEEYYSYEDKKIIYNKTLELLTIKLKDIFIIMSLNKDNIKSLIDQINLSNLKEYVGISEIKDLKNSSFSELFYPFLLEEFINAKNNYTIDFYDKLSLSINAFKNGLKENNQLYHYMSFILLSSLLEELFLYVSKKENIPLDKTYSISDCVDKLKGKMSLKVKHPDAVKENNGEKELIVYSEQNNSNNIFSKSDKVIGKKIINLLNELKEIRTKYVHFVSQKPNNPSDNLIGILCFGQFLIWCEENEYL